jgi:gamma-glutamylaminecyclotransferase
MATITLFVYGSLKRGSPQNRLLAGQRFLGTAQTLPQYRLYDNGTHPCLIPATEQGVAVLGELWCVDEEALARLDEYEGTPHDFQRQLIAVARQTTPVWAYIYRGNVASFKDCGQVWP